VEEGVVSKFIVDDMGVRFADGKPLCVTSHSIHLDNADGYAVKAYDNRQAWAVIIAKALNAYFERPAPKAPPLPTLTPETKP
jgi:hypothetical protein